MSGGGSGRTSALAARGALYACSAVVVAFLLAPIAIIVPMSFSRQPYLEFPPQAWTLRWYHDLADQPRWLMATINSICIALPTTALSVIFGTLAAVGVSQANRRWARSVSLLVLAPMMLPHVIIAIGLYPTLADLHLQDSYAAIIIGHSVIGIPLVFLTVLASLGIVPDQLGLAARTLGAGPWQAFRRVTLPMVRIGIVQCHTVECFSRIYGPSNWHLN